MTCTVRHKRGDLVAKLRLNADPWDVCRWLEKRLEFVEGPDPVFEQVLKNRQIEQEDKRRKGRKQAEENMVPRA